MRRASNLAVLLAACSAAFLLCAPLQAKSPRGLIKKGVSELKAKKQAAALELLTEAWAEGSPEEQKLAAYYLEMVISMPGTDIPSIKEAEKRIAAGVPARPKRRYGDAGLDGVRPSAVIYHSEGARVRDESLRARGMVGATLPKLNDDGSVMEPDRSVPEHVRLQRMKLARRPAPPAKPVAAARAAAPAPKPPAKPAPPPEPGEELIYRKKSAVVVASADHAAPGVVAVGDDSGGEKPSAQEDAGQVSPVRPAEEVARIRVQAAAEGALLPGSSPEKKSAAPLLSGYSEDNSGAGAAADSLRGRREGFVIEDYYAEEPPEEKTGGESREIAFPTDSFSPGPAVVAALEELRARVSGADISVTIRGLSSPAEQDPENLARVRAKMIEKLMRKKARLPEERVTVEWGVGVDSGDQRVLVLLKPGS